MASMHAVISAESPAYETKQLAVEGGIDGAVTQAEERSAAIYQHLAMKDHRVVRV